MKTKVILLTLALGATTCLLLAQEGNPRPAGQRPPGAGGAGGVGGPGAPGAPGAPGGQRPQMNTIIAALDLNLNGTLDADEIAKASESLKKLDKNGDGKITPDEYRPQRPGGPGGPGAPGTPGAPGGAGGAGGQPPRPPQNK